jgi:hypothetical protein
MIRVKGRGGRETGRAGRGRRKGASGIALSLPESDVPRKVVADADRGAVQTAIGLLERERMGSSESKSEGRQRGKKQEEKRTRTRGEEEGKHEKGA